MKARIYLSLLVSTLLGLGLTTTIAQAQFLSGWVVDAHAYEFDMSAFITLRQGQTPVNRWTDLQVGAFSNTECRGISTVQQIDTTGLFYYYLRIRSNTQKGDTIYFKCFDKSNGLEIVMPGVLVFEQLNQLGNPSSPHKLYFLQPVSGIKLNVDSMVVNLGEQGTLLANILPSDATNKQVLWKSSDTLVARISDKGVISPVKEGNCTITATTVEGSFSATCRITVVKVVGLLKLKDSEIQLLVLNDHLYLKGLQTSDLIQIVSIDGIIQKSVITAESSIRLSLFDLQKGCYLIRICRNQQIHCYKFLR